MDLLPLNVNKKLSAKSEHIFNIQFLPRKLGQIKFKIMYVIINYLWSEAAGCARSC